MVLSSVNITADDRALVQVFKKMKSEPRVALVIGNNNYQKPFSSLNNTINDAKAMKNILETRGFKVIYKTNVTKREFDESLEKFVTNHPIETPKLGLFYF
jgi:mitochondrial fission protein ELM1